MAQVGQWEGEAGPDGEVGRGGRPWWRKRGGVEGGGGRE